jgi:hypothetical protein
MRGANRNCRCRRNVPAALPEQAGFITGKFMLTGCAKVVGFDGIKVGTGLPF